MIFTSKIEGDAPVRLAEKHWVYRICEGFRKEKTTLIRMVFIYKHETGFEPATLALARRCSTTEPLVQVRFFALA